MFAGGLLLIFIVSRLMNRMRGSLSKLLFLAALALVFTLGPAFCGWYLAGHTAEYAYGFLAFPAVVILLWVLYELRLQRRKKSIQGPPPDSVLPPPAKGLAFLTHPVTTCDLTQVNYTLSWAGPELTVVQLTDLHLNHAVPMDYYQQVIDQANALSPDMIFLSGDFVNFSHQTRLLPGLLKQLTTTPCVLTNGTQPGKAVFASLGNHDYWSDPSMVRQALRDSGVYILSPTPISASRDGFEFLLVADDRPWGPGVDLDSSPVHNIPGFILSHAPDNIFDLARFPGWWVVFSGHVHAGQFRVPLPWGNTAVLVPSKYGRLLDHGHFILPYPAANPAHRYHHFVSAGIGASEPPVRLYCPPEILVVRLKPENP